MSVQKNTGEEHRRSNPKAMSGSFPESPTGKDSPKPRGVQSFDDSANMRADQKVLNGKDAPLPTDYTHDVPPGVMNYDDNGQKAGGTKYLGRD